MPLVDEQGRVFGKINLVDAAIVIFVLLLVPLAYATSLLFRVPPPRILLIQPSSIVLDEKELRSVKVQGENLRPFLRAFVGGREGTYLFLTPELAEVRLPKLEPGQYDLTLHDEVLEVARLDRAVTITSTGPRPALATVRLVGAFTGLDADEVGGFLKPAWLQGIVRPWAQVVELGTRELDIAVARGLPDGLLAADKYRVPAILRVKCLVQRGHVELASRKGIALLRDPALEVPAGIEYSTKVEPGVTLIVPFFTTAASAAVEPVPPRLVSFRVDQVLPPDTTELLVRIRMVLPPEVFRAVRTSVGAAPGNAFTALRPRLLEIESIGETVASKAHLESVGETVAPGEQLVVAQATVRVPASQTDLGWRYADFLLRPGAPFRLEAPSYYLSGTILSVEPIRQSDR